MARLRPTHRWQDAPLLTPEEEQTLAARVHGEDPDDAMAARNELVVRNLRLVYRAARRKAIRWTRPVEDMEQDGTIGLMRAAEKYEPGRGRFSSYATCWVKQAIQYGIAGDNLIRPARSAWDRMMDDWDGREVPERYREEVEAGNLAVKCRAAGWEPGGSQPLDWSVASPEGRDIEAWNDIDAVRTAMDRLPDRYRYVLHQRHIEGEPLSKVGIMLNLSTERVRQLQEQAEIKLRAMLAG